MTETIAELNARLNRARTEDAKARMRGASGSSGPAKVGSQLSSTEDQLVAATIKLHLKCKREASAARAAAGSIEAANTLGQNGEVFEAVDAAFKQHLAR